MVTIKRDPRSASYTKLIGLLTALAVLVASVNVTYASAGDLDLTFASVGYVITDVNSTSGDTAYSVLVQPDNKILASGSIKTGAKRDFALVRYNSNGVADSGFGSSGIVVTAISTGTDEIYASVLQGDGNIIAVGKSASHVAVVRYLSTTGALDTSFGASGIVTTTIGATASGQAVAIQSNGRIVVAGTANKHFFVARYLTNGTLDSSFNGSGIATTSVGAADWGQGVAIQSDNKIVVAGYSDMGLSEDFTILRYTSGGALDTSFNFTGKVTTDFQSNSTDQARAVALQPDGRIVAAGFFNAGGNMFAAARYNTNGSLDTSFNGSGKVMTAIGTKNEAKALAIQPTGKIVVAGDTHNGADYDFAIVRYKSNGTLDDTFNSAGTTPGVVQTDLTGVGSDDLGYAVAIQPDNRIVVAGSCDQGTFSGLDFTVARYESPFTPPVVTDFSKTGLENQVIVFSASDFTSHYADAEDSALAMIMVTSLPLSGTLHLSGTLVSLNQVISTTNLDTLTFTPQADWYGATSFTWNGSNGLTYATTDATVDISITYVNQAPSFNKGLDQIILEDSAAQTLSGWATNISPGPLSESWQVVTFTTSTNNGAIFTTTPTIDANTGDMTYTPAPDMYGIAVVTATLSDSGGTANGGVDTAPPQTFIINIIGVNDAPSFNVGPDQSVLVGSGPQNAPAWATSIAAGPTNEATQVLTFTLITSNNAIFATLPAIHATTGDLTYTPSATTWGSAVVTVTLKDNGGIAFGGVDTSAPLTFTVSVQPYRLLMPIVMR